MKAAPCFVLFSPHPRDAHAESSKRMRYHVTRLRTEGHARSGHHRRGREPSGSPSGAPSESSLGGEPLDPLQRSTITPHSRRRVWPTHPRIMKHCASYTSMQRHLSTMAPTRQSSPSVVRRVDRTRGPARRSQSSCFQSASALDVTVMTSKCYCTGFDYSGWCWCGSIV